MSLSGCRCVCTSLTDNTQCHPNRFVAVLNEQLTYHNVTSWAISVTTQAEDEVTRRGYNHEEVLLLAVTPKLYSYVRVFALALRSLMLHYLQAGAGVTHCALRKVITKVDGVLVPVSSTPQEANVTRRVLRQVITKVDGILVAVGSTPQGKGTSLTVS